MTKQSKMPQATVHDRRGHHRPADAGRRRRGRTDGRTISNCDGKSRLRRCARRRRDQFVGLSSVRFCGRSTSQQVGQRYHFSWITCDGCDQNWCKQDICLQTGGYKVRICELMKCKPWFALYHCAAVTTTLSYNKEMASRLMFNVCQISQRLTNCVMLKMTNCLTKPSGSQITCCTHCCRHHPLRRNATISDSVDTRYSCRNTPRTQQTATSLHTCYTETHVRLVRGTGFVFTDNLNVKAQYSFFVTLKIVAVLIFK